MNKLFITGRVGRTPETRTISTGDTVCSFSLAVDNKRKGGQDQPPTWFKISAWGKLGEVCQRYLTKGKMATVIGPVSVSTYEGKDGTRFSLDVLARKNAGSSSASSRNLSTKRLNEQYKDFPDNPESSLKYPFSILQIRENRND